MNNYDAMTTEDFDRLLAKVMDEEVCPSALLGIPGIYEVVSEHYNNAVLDAWTEEQRKANALPYTAKYTDAQLKNSPIPGERYHAIYTLGSKDYCQETLPGNITAPDEARAYARKLFLKVADAASQQLITGFWLDRY